MLCRVGPGSSTSGHRLAFVLSEKEGSHLVSYPADNIIMVCQMSLAVLAPKDLVGGQVDVV